MKIDKMDKIIVLVSKIHIINKIHIIDEFRRSCYLIDISDK